MISIIIPVFNEEKKIERLISDIFNQTYKDYEIIVVDDGSTDSTGRIVEAIKLQEFVNIHYIRTENRGPSHARNVGISNANGEWIVFIDADDSVSEKHIECLHSGIEMNGADMCFSSYYVQSSNGLTHMSTEMKAFGNYDGFIILRDFLLRKVPISLWNSIFLKEIINRNGIMFNENVRLGEDYDFIARYLQYCKTVMINNEITYTYFRELKKEKSRFANRVSDQILIERELEHFYIQKQNIEAARIVREVCYPMACIYAKAFSNKCHIEERYRIPIKYANSVGLIRYIKINLAYIAMIIFPTSKEYIAERMFR